METDRCPKCDATPVVAGYMNPQGGGFYRERFTPLGLSFFRLRPWWWGAPRCEKFHACLACGFVWSQLLPGDLRAFVHKYGNAKSRLTLAQFQKGPSDPDAV